MRGLTIRSPPTVWAVAPPCMCSHRMAASRLELVHSLGQIAAHRELFSSFRTGLKTAKGPGRGTLWADENGAVGRAPPPPPPLPPHTPPHPHTHTHTHVVAPSVTRSLGHELRLCWLQHLIEREFDLSKPETVAGNMWPMVQRAGLADRAGGGQLFLVGERAHAVSSHADGQMEVLLQRRTTIPDGFGTGETLDETQPVAPK